ncbi:MAG: hypothetical protein MJ072_01730, partial [Clostridia bacterium]|nr:hypothetical protein [Clostridia bacterium]
MSGKIYTPNSLWEDFKISSTDFIRIVTRTVGETEISEYYVNRQVQKKEKISVYVKVAVKAGESPEGKPAVFVLQDASTLISDNDLTGVVDMGYTAIAMDMSG